MKIIPGTEKLVRYPFLGESSEKGLLSFGRLGDAYKADDASESRLRSVGYIVVKRGTSYIYVRKEKQEVA